MNYTSVPNIITSKDLDYLTDIFNWNYGAYKSNVNALNEIKNDEVKRVVNKAVEFFNNTIMDILAILASGGANE